MVPTFMKVLLPLLLHTIHLAAGYDYYYYPPTVRDPKGEGRDPLEGIDVSSMLTVVKSTPKTVTVNVQQSLIGDPTDCESSAKANFFFMVFKHGQTGEDICPFYRDVDACFERTITLQCDPTTNQAGIDVYTALDHSGTLRGKATVENPFVGKCFPRRDTLERSAKYSAVVDCVQVVEGRPYSCADVLALSPDAKDGEYVIWHKYHNGVRNDMPMNVYCHNMNGPGAPKEYVTLLYRDRNVSSNLFDLKGLRTFYDKIRIDPVTLKVDIADPTFSSTGLPRDEYSFVPYGVTVRSRAAKYPAVSSIDLRDTSFKIADVDDFSVSVEKTRHFLVKADNNDQTMKIVNYDWSWFNLGPPLDDAPNAPLGSYNFQLALL